MRGIGTVIRSAVDRATTSSISTATSSIQFMFRSTRICSEHVVYWGRHHQPTTSGFESIPCY